MMSELDKITTEVPPSGVPLTSTSIVVPTLKEHMSNVSEVYKF